MEFESVSHRIRNDGRHTVTLHPRGKGWPISLHYARIAVGGKPDVADWFNVGLEVGAHPETEDDVSQATRIIAPKFLREVVDEYRSLDTHARNVLNGGLFTPSTRKAPAIKVDRMTRQRHEWTPEFFATISALIEEHEAAGMSPAKGIARDYGVTVATAYRWINETKKAPNAR